MTARFVVVLALALAGACSTAPTEPAQASAGSSESSAGSGVGSESDSGASTAADLPTITGEGISGETGEPEPDCDIPGYLDCVEAELGPWTTCLAACVDDQQSCLADTCEASCAPARAAAEAACAHLCPAPGEWSDPCADQCDVEHEACLAAGCAALDCDYDRYVCAYADYCTCAIFDTDFTWAGGCELVPVGPPVSYSVPYTYVELGDDDLFVADPGTTCDQLDDTHAAVFAPGRPPSSVVLCEAACQAFEAAGTVKLVFGSPPCE